MTSVDSVGSGSVRTGEMRAEGAYSLGPRAVREFGRGKICRLDIDLAGHAGATGVEELRRQELPAESHWRSKPAFPELYRERPEFLKVADTVRYGAWVIEGEFDIAGHPVP